LINSWEKTVGYPIHRKPITSPLKKEQKAFHYVLGVGMKGLGVLQSGRLLEGCPKKGHDREPGAIEELVLLQVREAQEEEVLQDA